VKNPSVKIIDASTAHRTSPGWTYGFAELSAAQYEKIAASKRTANPGCHASGFIALVKPLIEAGLLKKDAELTATSVTGYSGGGKKMIAQYEAENRDKLLDYPRPYSLALKHKHLKEMLAMCELRATPAFLPIVADFYSGMCITVPVFSSQLNCPAQRVRELYAAHYSSGIVKYNPSADENGFASAGILSGKDSMEISVHGNEEMLLLTARYDNLGKGACGAAIENMNIMSGLNPTLGLIL